MRRRYAVLAAWLTATLFYSTIVTTAEQADAQRQAEVRERGAHVMPFRLDATLHHFDKTDSGGVQRVAFRAGHADQLEPIREHLQAIAVAFRARDFSGPARIHGADMPGLVDLQTAAAEDLDVVYRETADGAEVTYSSASPRLVAALHAWFDAQLHDHGADATHGHHRRD